MNNVNKVFLNIEENNNNNNNNNNKQLSQSHIYKENLINGKPPKAHNIQTKVIGIAEDGSIYERTCESCAYEIIGD